MTTKFYIDSPLPALEGSADARWSDVTRHLITFHSGGTWSGTGERLRRQAEAAGWFDRIEVFHPGVPHPAIRAFMEHHGEFARRHARGYGYMRWKPLLVEAALHALPEGGHLYWADAGCELSRFGRARFAALDHELAVRDVLCFHVVFPELGWSKRECVDAILGGWRDDVMSSPQVETSWMGFRNVPSVRACVAEWAAWAVTGELIADTHDSALQHPDFRAHRHDQSLLSLVLKKRGFASLPQEHCFSRWLYVRNSWVLLAPMHALRSRRSRSVLDRVVAVSNERDIRSNLSSPSISFRSSLVASRAKRRLRDFLSGLRPGPRSMGGAPT